MNLFAGSEKAVRQLRIIAFFICALSCSAEEYKIALPIATGPFRGTEESLTNYHCPDWFRDAKFGIWAHWGPQAVPMEGDWYARHIYEPANRQYAHHLATYGHPSTNGYKDIIPLWKAGKWDPERLMALYKKAGARYFVSMGSHHDNFYLWDSKLHEWNAVKMGPKRDVVGEWQKAAKKQGLRFGVSEHLGASFTWFQSSHSADKTGPLAGVPYDGADAKYESLYHFKAQPGDNGWYSKDPRWQQQWFDRIKELVDGYHPDLLYTDGGVPFGNEVGRSLIAHLYNQDPHRRGTKNEAVYTCKQKSEGRWVEDLERGVMPRINPNPWQTDTSIGDWFYNKNWKFRPVSWTIYMLADIVSKNGNLLLNVVQRPDGSLDPEVEQMLEELAAWTSVHGEAIYGTRPWSVYGEGAVRYKGGHFAEDFKYTARDIRFTTKGKNLYAIALGWPEDHEILIRSLAKPSVGQDNHIQSVSLLGYKGKVVWTQTTNGLAVKVPAEPISKYTTALRIIGDNLKPAAIAETAMAETVQQDAKGMITLRADTAELHGEQLKQETIDGSESIGFWDRGNEWLSWKLFVRQPGTFQVTLNASTVHPEAGLVLEIAGRTMTGIVHSTGAWNSFRTLDLGRVEISGSGEQTLKLKPADASNWKAINLREIKLSRISQ